MNAPTNKGDAPRGNTRGARPHSAAYEQFVKKIVAAKIAKAKARQKKRTK